MGNKNPETDTGVQDENQKSKAAKSLESSLLYQGSDHQRGDTIFSVTVDCNALHQTSDCNELSFLPTEHTSLHPAIPLLSPPP